MEIFDSISEKYRKYLINISYYQNSYYALWGTDMEENQQDKLLINEDKKVFLFKSKKGLRRFILSNEKLLFDRGNLISWSLYLDKLQPYANYNIDFLRDIIDKLETFDNLTKNENLMILNFINLVSDYAYQVNDKILISTIKNEEIVDYNDYIYNSFVWKSEDFKNKSDLVKFKEAYKNILLLFEEIIAIS